MNKLSIGLFGVVLLALTGCAAAQPEEGEGEGEAEVVRVAVAPVEGTVTPQQRNQGTYGCQQIWDITFSQYNLDNCIRLSPPNPGSHIDQGLVLGCYFSEEQKFLSACKGTAAN